MLAAALAVRFILELCLLATNVWAAYRFAPGIGGICLATIAAIAIATLWGMFLSPKRRLELGALPRLFLELALFAGAAWLLFSAGHPALGAALLGVELVDKSLLEWLQRTSAD